MIKVTVEFDSNGVIKKLEISGHSTYEKKGNNIVCAAFSILLYSLHCSLQKIPGVKMEFFDDALNVKLTILEIKREAIGEVRGISIMFANGLKLLERDYSKELKLIIKYHK